MGATRGVIAMALVSALAATAAADGFDAERFTPATGGEGSFAVEHPAVPFHLGWSLGLFLNLADCYGARLMMENGAA